MREIAGVFNVYGIGVNPRHLGVVADYMVWLFFVFLKTSSSSSSH